MYKATFRDFFKLEAAGGILLLLAAALAMVLKNSPFGEIYDAFLDVPVQLRVGALDIDKPLLLWINDGLMAVFFFTIGMEVKREILVGELSDLRQTILPVVAGLGGIIVPAAIYIMVAGQDPNDLRGWAIPTATDIAFALGILALAGPAVPTSLKLFLMTEIVRRVRTTCIVATHDQEEAMTMADRIALMRRGRIIQTGTPAEVYEFPNSAFSAEFLGTANLFSGTVSGSEEGVTIVDVPDLGYSLKVTAPEVPTEGMTVTVLVRPEKIELRADSSDDQYNSCQGVIADVAYTGANTNYHVRLNSGRKVVVRVDSGVQHRSLNLDLGAPVFVCWAASDGVVLNS